MRVLGIDPGSETTGWGVIDSLPREQRLVNYGAVRTAADDRFASRLRKISDGLEAVIARYKPDVCAIEESFFAVNVKTALKLGHVRGVALLAAERAGLEIHEYSPRLVKQTVVGYGAAEKHQVQEMVRVLLKLKRGPQPYDAADALAIAICHIHHAGVIKRAAATSRVSSATVLAALRRRAPR